MQTGGRLAGILWKRRKTPQNTMILRSKVYCGIRPSAIKRKSSFWYMMI